MPRIRTVKPEYFHSETMASVSIPARLLGIALLNLADREGRLRWIPLQVHAHAFPHDEGIDIGALADELEGIGYLRRYEVAGKRYAVVVNFTAHQRITGKEAQAESNIPEPPGETTACEREAEGKHPGASPEIPREAPGCPGNRGTGEQGKGIPTTSEAEPPGDPVKELFDTGRALLTDAGVSKAQAGKHLGKLRRDHGDEAVLHAVREVARLRPSDPSAYLERLCRGESGKQLVDAMTGGVSWS